MRENTQRHKFLNAHDSNSTGVSQSGCPGKAYRIDENDIGSFLLGMRKLFIQDQTAIVTRNNKNLHTITQVRQHSIKQNLLSKGWANHHDDISKFHCFLDISGSQCNLCKAGIQHGCIIEFSNSFDTALFFHSINLSREFWGIVNTYFMTRFSQRIGHSHTSITCTDNSNLTHSYITSLLYRY